MDDLAAIRQGLLRLKSLIAAERFSRALYRHYLVLKAGYREDQLRDELGRWAEEGNGAETGQMADAHVILVGGPPGLPRAVWKQTVQQFVSRYCRAHINREIPGQFRDVTIEDLIELRNGGDVAAKKCYKLLNEQRFRK